MSFNCRLGWVVIRFVPLLLLVCVASVVLATPAHAEGGLAFSGSFSRQDFELPQGTSIAGAGVDVFVFNNSDEELSVRMVTEAPPGVDIILSQSEFTLRPGGQQRAMVEVKASHDAVPGTYEISITAETYRSGGDGLQVLGAAGQKASLTIVGESARVSVETLSPDGDPVVSVIRLFKLVGSESYELAYSDTGELRATVSPGRFLAVAYIGDQQVAEETFEVGVDEERRIVLTAQTIYFQGFGVVPHFDSATGELAFAQMVYTLKNVYEPVSDAEIVLRVTHDSALMEELSIATMSTLDLGDLGLTYNYIPSGGWQAGSYGFKLTLNLGAKPYAGTLVESVTVEGDGFVSSNEGNGGGSSNTNQQGTGAIQKTSIPEDEPTAGEPDVSDEDDGEGIGIGLIGGIVAGVLVVIALAYYLGRRRTMPSGERVE